MADPRTGWRSPRHRQYRLDHRRRPCGSHFMTHSVRAGLAQARNADEVSGLFVIVDGPPASGKSTLAPVLAERLGLPLVAKDTIKDALMRVLEVSTVDASRQIGRAAVVAMLAVASESSIGAVIESNLFR